MDLHGLVRGFNLQSQIWSQNDMQTGWNGGKVRGQKMVGEQKKFYFLSFLFGWEWKSGRIEKVSLYKFMHIPLLKNNTQLKPKKG